MTCQDVRRALAALVDGKLALTEWAIIQTHLRECAECRTALDLAHSQAGERVRIRRWLTVAAGLAAAAVLIVLVGGGVYLYRSGVPGPFHRDSFRLPEWATAPPPTGPVPAAARAPEPPAPVEPPQVAPPPLPPVRPKVVVEPALRAPLPAPAPAPEPAPRSTRPAATVETAPEERMPTQARPSTALSAPAGAEAMPTQGPARPRPRSE